MTRVALLGAGIIGSGIAQDLAVFEPRPETVVGDLDGGRAEAVGDQHGFDAAQVDVTDEGSLDGFLAGCDAVINAVQYEANLAVMEGALRARCHYLDLGGLFHTTRRQLELDGRFRDAGITAVLGIGSCPGIANVHAGDLASRLDEIDSLVIYNGATVDPSDSLRWPYSIRTILDEMTRAPVVFRDGAFVEAEPLSGRREFPFREPIGTAEVHLSLHSEVATIPVSLADKGIRECAFLIRNFGFSDGAMAKLRLLVDLGLASTEPREVGDAELVPRELLIDLLEELDPPPPEHDGFKDIATVARGRRGGDEVEVRIDTTAWPSEELGLAGGTVTVVSPAAIVGRWLASGELEQPGVHPPESVVPAQALYDELARRGCTTTVEETTTMARPEER